MKLTRVLFVVLMLGLVASVAHADAIDPKITVGGGGSCESFALTSLTQSFQGLPTTGCLIDFQNDILNGKNGVTLTKIVVNVTSSFIGPLGCGIGPNSPFNSFTQTATSCTFFASQNDDNQGNDNAQGNEDGSGGLPPGGIFSLNFNNLGGPGFGTSVDITIAQTVIATPEPASAILLLAGAGALLAFRRRR